MESSDGLKKVISMINTGKQFPAVQLVKANPELAAVVSKLVKSNDVNNTFDPKKEHSYHNLNQSQIQAISDNTKSRIRDNENVMQLFPDIELAVQIIVSSILSPKDMVKTDIIYKAKEAILPAELTLKLNDIVSSHFESYYDIKNELSTILREALFSNGSHIKAIIPESVVDELINSNKRVTTESLAELFTLDNAPAHLGILGNPGEVSKIPALERFASNKIIPTYSPNIKAFESLENYKSLVEVTDNFKLFKLPFVLESHKQNKIKSIIKGKYLSTESNAKLNSAEFSSLVYKNKSGDSKEFISIPTQGNSKRKSVGRPLVLNLPSEAVIPVYVPGSESKHIGYFVLVDADGNPVTLNSNQEHMQGLSGLMANQGQNQSLSSLLIQKAKRNLVSSDGNNLTLDQVTKVYAGIIESDLIERLKNGVYGGELAIANNEEIYRIMLARTFANKFTRLIFIPAELVTYFAFKYFNNGVGKSYLDDLKILTSLRAILLFSKVMAMTKNSIALTHVGITLDPNDPDPQKTIEMATHEIVKMRQQYFPLGINSPVDLVDWIQRAGFEFSFEGHPGLPQTKFDFETKNLQHSVPDSDLDEQLRKQTYMALGLSPEIVDNGFNSEFATTVVSNNILLSKRILQLQFIFTEKLSDFCHKLVLNDNIIIKELKDALLENKGLIEKVLTDEEKVDYSNNPDGFVEDLIERYVYNIELDLPKPDETSLENQAAAFDQYVEAIDKAIDSWISSEIITNDLAGDISSNIDSIKAIVKGHFLRKWMAENNYMSDLASIVTTTEDGKPSLDIYDINKSHIEGLIRSSIRFIESLTNVKNAANKDLTALNVEAGSSSDSSYSDDSSGDSGSAGSDNFGMGGDDFSTDFGTELVPEETTEEVKTPEEKTTEEETTNESEETK